MHSFKKTELKLVELVRTNNSYLTEMFDVLYQACTVNSSTEMTCTSPDLGQELDIGNLPGPVNFDYGFLMDGVTR